MDSHMRSSIPALLAVFLMIMGISCSRTGDTSYHILFETEAPDTIPYRIPAIAALSDGSLLALADYRHCRSDIGWGRVDIHGRMSSDNGKTWTMTRQMTSDSGTNHTYIRRPFYADDGFWAYWADGRTDRFTRSNLYFSTKEGKIYRMPYDMTDEWQKPEEYN